VSKSQIHMSKFQTQISESVEKIDQVSDFPTYVNRVLNSVRHVLEYSILHIGFKRVSVLHNWTRNASGLLCYLREEGGP